MCRWLAYSGTPVLLDEVLYRPKHSLIDQSLHSRMGVERTNGDGFGVGWYTEHARTPAIFRDTGPAWSNRNLREIADHVRSPLFFAHIRASLPYEVVGRGGSGLSAWGQRAAAGFLWCVLASAIYVVRKGARRCPRAPPLPCSSPSASSPRSWPSSPPRCSSSWAGATAA